LTNRRRRVCSGLADLTHIDSARAVTELFLFNTRVGDLTPLARLSGLRVLRLDNARAPVALLRVAALRAARPAIEILGSPAG